MRIPPLVCLILALPGCANHAVQTTLCDMGPEFRTWQGSVVRLHAMLLAGGEEAPPMIVDTHCWRGIAADFSDTPDSAKILNVPGRFNKFAQVTGRMRWGDGDRMWLHVTSTTDVRVGPPKSEAAEDAFFRRMVSEANAYFHPKGNPETRLAQ